MGLEVMAEDLELKLFVWENVLEDYGFGKMFALASDAEHVCGGA